MTHTQFLTILFLSSAPSLLGSIAHTTHLIHPDTKQTVILLEDIHSTPASAQIDPAQSNALRHWLEQITRPTDFIIECPQEKWESYSLLNVHTDAPQAGPFTWLYNWCATFVSFLNIYAEPALQSVDSTILLDDIIVHATHAPQWQQVISVPGDPRCGFDTALCLTVSAWQLASLHALKLFGYKQLCITPYNYNYTQDDPEYCTVLQSIQCLQKIPLAALPSRFAEMEMEFKELREKCAAYNLLPPSFLRTLESEFHSALNNARLIFEQNEQHTHLNHLDEFLVALFNEKKDFDTFWITAQGLMKPSMILTDISFLEEILYSQCDRITTQTILFAGMSHTVNVQRYLEQIGYITSIESPCITWSAESDTNQKMWHLPQQPFFEHLCTLAH